MCIQYQGDVDDWLHIYFIGGNSLLSHVVVVSGDIRFEGILPQSADCRFQLPKKWGSRTIGLKLLPISPVSFFIGAFKLVLYRCPAKNEQSSAVFSRCHSGSMLESIALALSRDQVSHLSAPRLPLSSLIPGQISVDSDGCDQFIGDGWCLPHAFRLRSRGCEESYAPGPVFLSRLHRSATRCWDQLQESRSLEQDLHIMLPVVRPEKLTINNVRNFFKIVPWDT